ncbi:MAG: methyltransferase [Candidatus Thermoplasmatota archaeon]|nr:methyltransferase [Euryarchaeota archaeon]MBU4032539.1 methyltransferase [Candidatus Thermoplasmatota archaeon]MBU4072012.1 methyltransferase [Candidatus Thermoplasmatota archaeon]MBU4144543.1 methyltransferase [Candidatus Thermoplasmatota archaeon]MBU4592092.1 methyltransferase [Candidatus Thermoplasmatota archaeon]
MDSDSTIQIESCARVYPPAEDTYLLLSAVEVSEGQRVLEMGTGSGIIALHCAKAGCRTTAADISPDAVKCARENAEINGLAMEIIESDLFENINEKFNAIIFNPPYLSGQDSEGLTDSEKRPLVGGEKGHEISARFLEVAPRFLAPGGRIYLLTSSESETEVLKKARERFSIAKITEKRIFFETLAVHMLKMLTVSEK